MLYLTLLLKSYGILQPYPPLFSPLPPPARKDVKAAKVKTQLIYFRHSLGTYILQFLIVPALEFPSPL